MQNQKEILDISIITPVYNEEINIDKFIKRITSVLTNISEKYEIIFVLDPSSDGTESKIKDCLITNKKIKLIKMSRRFGQPASTLAGIHHSSGNKVVVIDVDLQDPPELISEMYKKIEFGFDVVVAKRRSRRGETFLKEIISEFGYKIINYFSDLKIPRNVGDFRMINKKIVEHLKTLQETNGYLRGMVSFVGFKQTEIEFDRQARDYGISKYNKFTGSFEIGLNGLFCYSNKPLYLSLIVSMISFLVGFILIVANFFIDISTLLIIFLILFLFNFFFIVIMSQYIGRIYDEVKKRPLYIIEEKINF